MYCSDKQPMYQSNCKLPKCKAECVKTFTTEYKLYRICCYKLYKTCSHCGCEFDYHHHHRCPHCAMGSMKMGSMKMSPMDMPMSYHGSKYCPCDDMD